MYKSLLISILPDMTDSKGSKTAFYFKDDYLYLCNSQQTLLKLNQKQSMQLFTPNRQKKTCKKIVHIRKLKRLRQAQQKKENSAEYSCIKRIQ